jgi:hypothetical protein
MADLTEEGTALIFNTPNRATSLPGYLKMGWQVVAEWPVYVRVLRPLGMLRGLLRPGRDVGQSLAFEDQEILSWERFASQYRSQIAALIAASEEERAIVGYRTPRDLAYLEWRYGRHPSLHYGVYPLVESGTLAGFAVVRERPRRGWQEAIMADLYVRRASGDLGRRLLTGLCRALKSDYLLAHFQRGTAEHAMLRRVGFFRVPGRGLLMVARPLNPLPHDPLKSANWDLCLGDLEVF